MIIIIYLINIILVVVQAYIDILKVLTDLANIYKESNLTLNDITFINELLFAKGIKYAYVNICYMYGNQTNAFSQLMRFKYNNLFNLNWCLYFTQYLFRYLPFVEAMNIDLLYKIRLLIVVLLIITIIIYLVRRKGF
jgi:hypothetical protein